MFNSTLQLWILNQTDCWDAERNSFDLTKLWERRATILNRKLNEFEAHAVVKESNYATDLYRKIRST